MADKKSTDRNMTYERLSLCCECGQPCGRIKDVGFTSDHQLVVHWRCSWCKRPVYRLKPLADCWRKCPTAERGDEVEVAEFQFGPDDVRFLHSIGATLLTGAD